jgi:hypothetical protein
MGMKGLAAAAALVALAGCADYDDRVRGGGRTGIGNAPLPEVAMAGRPDQVVPPGRWRTGLALRSFVPGAAPGTWDEVVGAQCQVTGGDYFRASAVTPVRLVLPDLGPDAPPLTAICTSGTLSGRETVLPAYGWPDEGRPPAYERAAWGAGWWWGFQKTGPLRYPDLAVPLVATR